MALGFFRRHQKVVFVIMVVLMVAFLIPSSINRLFSGPQGADVRGTAYGKKVKIAINDLILAERDLLVLKGTLGIGYRRDMDSQLMHMFEQVNTEDRQMVWCLLLKEAKRLGIHVTDAQVTKYLADMGLSGDALRREINQMSLEKKTEQDLYQSVADFLMVKQAFQTSQINAPPSLPEVKQAYRDISEQIQLAVAGLSAADFTSQAKEPADQQIKAWFDRYRTVGRGDVADVQTATSGPAVPTTQTTQPDKYADTFGFSYRQPDRADVAYIFIDRDAVEQAVEPATQQMMEYWRLHKGELTKKVPLSQPAGTQSSQPVKEKEVVITQYSEAIPQIHQILQSQVADARLNDLQNRIRELLGSMSSTTASAQSGPAADLYKRVVAAMLRPADALLDTKIGRLPFANETLENVINQLSKNTGVKIVYPYGKDEKIKIDPTVTVDVSKLTAESKLGDALAAISTSLKYPAVKWVTCETMDNALFPTEPVARLPVKAIRTGLVTLQEPADDPVLNDATLSEKPSPGGDTVFTIIKSAAELAPPASKQVALIEVGSDFRQPMFVPGDRPGRLIWRLMAVQREHDPKDVTPEIRKQVIEDIKTYEAFKLAQQAASKLLAAVRAGGDLEKLAEKDKYKFNKTELFSRKQFNPYFGGMVGSSVPPVGRNPEFVRLAFALAPADPDKPGNNKPAEDISLPRLRMVVVVQRIGYKPATMQDFARVEMYLGDALRQQQAQQSLAAWFAGENVKKRTEFVPTEPGRRGPIRPQEPMPLDDGGF